ncbi:mismatch repair protein [Granulicella sp. dw_53]|uniref:MutS-related protein n=1 Tax=Granulicella sp. dw_53 TaxID=2719792 RepID=UPI001BD1C673|nr:mismatch repair protein [Granulicella sp. dw_53]
MEDMLSGSTPETIYTQRLAQAHEAQSHLNQRDRRFITAKLLAGGVILALIFWSFKHPALLLMAPVIVVLIFLFVAHERVLKALRFNRQVVAFYQRGIARVNGKWQGTGESGDAFLDPLHPYARDLDLFGSASLFELLCTARTRAGESTLARWLLAPASVEEIRLRQAAVAELTPLLDLRQRLFTFGDDVRLGVHPEALSHWGESANRSITRQTRLSAMILSVLWLASLAALAITGRGTFALVTSLINLGFSFRLHGRLNQTIEAVERAAPDMKLLSEVLHFIETQSFTAPRLTQLQATLQREGVPPSAAIRRLSHIVESLESRRNPFALALDLFILRSTHLAYSAEQWQQEFGPAIRTWLAAVGELEALAALSNYAFEHPTDTFPALVTAPRPIFEATAFAHPLLPATAVRNDLRMGSDLQLVIVSGPNMAGKSTFMRAIGVNVVLAQCGAPVRAERFVLSPLAVAASICILDSLQGGVSRFYAEINRLKLISDLTQLSTPVFFLLDELLSGTNSHDRLIGTQFFVQSLLKHGAIGIVTTHDLALTRIPEAIGPQAINCHFEDHIEENADDRSVRLHFDYKLHPGVVQTSNALELMRSIGLDVGRG